jgi:hypothetical protein
MDIVFVIDGICTLVDVIIVDSTHANFISWLIFSCGMVVTITA